MKVVGAPHYLLTLRHESVVSAAQEGGKPSPESMMERARHALIPNLSTARAMEPTCWPPASAKHVTCRQCSAGQALNLLLKIDPKQNDFKEG